jgi:hypothetical protein
MAGPRVRKHAASRRIVRVEHLRICRQDKERSHHVVCHVGFVQCGGFIPQHPCGRSCGTIEEVAGRTTPESGYADAVSSAHQVGYEIEFFPVQRKVL